MEYDIYPNDAPPCTPRSLKRIAKIIEEIEQGDGSRPTGVIEHDYD